MFWRRTDTTLACTFLADMHSAPWTLAAGSAIQVCSDRAAAEAFLKAHAGRCVPRVMLGPLQDIHTRSPQIKDLKFSYFIGVEIPASARAAIERKDAWFEPPHLWIEKAGRGVAAWRQTLPDFNKPKEAAAALARFAARFAAEHNCTCEPVMVDMPVPEVGSTGWKWARTLKGVSIHHDQLIRTPAPVKAATSTAAQGQQLAKTLSSFGVRATVTGVHVGPVITRFDIKLATGTKAASVGSVAKDVAREMGCESARVVDGSKNGTIGIELPNRDREIVSLQELLNSDAFKTTKAALPLALGKAIDGAPVIADLAEMPHLLVAGATGKGKSVGVNAMIQSLIRKLTPAQCAFIMIDPKMLELSVYGSIPHMMAPIIVEPEKAVLALEWCVKEMKRRYKVLSAAAVIDLAEYNATAGESMPRLVVVVDELAELMAGDYKAPAGTALQRLAQMGRACGIHLVVATQRPSVDVISGVIKGNFASRIAFQVATDVDSRVILDESGAEQLLGKGDSLYLSAGGAVTRVHGAFVSRDEVRAAVKEVKARFGLPHYREELAALLGADEDTDGGGAGPGMVSPAVEPQKRYTPTQLRYIAFLVRIIPPLTSGGIPIEGPKVRSLARNEGLTNIDALFIAADALGIDRRRREGAPANAPDLWTPPSEYPAEFESVTT